jgi:eukaryotic-like serine/threonine-protein kinase
MIPGDRLGPYEIVAPLGTGGMGEVYRARDGRLGREVAIKVLPAGASSDPDRLHRFEQEARAASALNHPYILSVYDAGLHDGRPYVVAELLDGQTLAKRLRDGPLSSGRAVDFAVQIAKGLAAAHEKGIVHRDLKPENLFLTRDGHVKILDFGLAKLTGPVSIDDRATGPLFTPPGSRPVTTAGTIMGTVGYLSPEQVRSEEVDARSDIFSFGVILHEMLAGAPPFKRESAVESLHAILKEDPLPIGQVDPRIPPALERVVLRCLEKDPENRFQSARDLAFHLEAVTGISSDATLTGPGLSYRPPPPRRRTPRWALVAAGGVAGAAALVAVFLAGRQSARPTHPTFQQLSFRRGTIHGARFAPDGRTIVYAASWEGNPVELLSSRSEGPESRPLEPRTANILSISKNGEMALMLLRGRSFARGTLARASLGGGVPRLLMEDVEWADWAPDGDRLAAVRSVPRAKRLEFPIGTVLYETPGWISHLRVSPRGDLVAFLDHPVPGDNRGSVAVVDKSGKVKKLAEGWKSAWGLAWSPSGREIWFTASEREAARSLMAVTLDGRTRVVARVPLRMTLHDISQDGRRVLFTNDLLRRSTLGVPPGEALERDLSWLDYSNAKDLSPDGRTLLFSEDGEAGGPTYSVYLRGTDGSPAVRLGDGKATSLSPDGKWALAVRVQPPQALQMLPTGAGEVRELPPGPLQRLDWASWFPDGQRVLVAGTEPGRDARLYVQSIAGGPPQPLSAGTVNAGFGSVSIAPDGTRVAVMEPDDSLVLYAVPGGEKSPVPGAEPEDVPVQWSEDGRFLYVFKFSSLPGQLVRIDLATGARSPWRQLLPSDPSGVLGITRVRMTRDGRSYVYTFSRILSDLHLAEGLE